MPAQQRAFSCADKSGRKNTPAENREGQTKSNRASRRYAQDHGSATLSRPDLFFAIDGAFTAALAAGPDRHRRTREPDGFEAAGLAASQPISEEIHLARL